MRTAKLDGSVGRSGTPAIEITANAALLFSSKARAYKVIVSSSSCCSLSLLLTVGHSTVYLPIFGCTHNDGVRVSVQKLN